MMFGCNNIISTKRLTLSSSKETYSASTTLSGLPCYIEHINPELAAMFDGANAFYTYKCFVDGTPDIVISDKVIDQASNEYIVFGVQKYSNNVDVDNHTEILMHKPYTA